MNSNNINKKTGSDLRNANMSLLLKEIRENGPMSRADLARSTGLTRSTVSSLTQDLLVWEFLQEIGYSDEISAGKKGTLLDIRQDKIYVLSVKLSDGFVYMAKVNLKGVSVRCSQYALDKENAESVILKLKELITVYLDDMRNEAQICYGIGITVPSPVRNGAMAFSLSFQYLENVNLEKAFEDIFDGPVHVSNNADAAALAETWFAGMGEKDRLAFVLIEQGIGCGIVLNKEVYFGPQLFSNEFGHMIVKEDGPVCFCGNRGCLASLASDWSVSRQIKQEMNGEIPEKLFEGDLESDGKLFSYMLKNPGKFSRYTNQAARYMGIAIANMIDLLMPDVVVVDGNLALMPEFVEGVKEACKEHVHPFFRDIVNIRRSHLKEDAVLIGASAFLLRELYANPNLINKNIYNNVSVFNKQERSF